jgi:hypothetical protein
MQTETASPRRFPELIRVRSPRGMQAALQAAAARRHTSPAEVVRQAVLQALRADGIDLRDTEPEGRA